MITENDLKLGSELLSRNKLIMINKKEDLDFINSSFKGCYFIFSNIPTENLPVLNDQGKSTDCFKKPLIGFDLIEYRCIYNGKSDKTKHRIKQHLFNNVRISNTKAMRLGTISKEELDLHNGKLEIKPRRIKEKRIVYLREIGDGDFDRMMKTDENFYREGINIAEESFSKFRFAIILVPAKDEEEKLRIEQAFWNVNGMPPLNARKG